MVPTPHRIALTSTELKKQHKKNGPRLNERQQKQLERDAELEERATRARKAEESRKAAKKKREEREAKEARARSPRAPAAAPAVMRAERRRALTPSSTRIGNTK